MKSLKHFYVKPGLFVQYTQRTMTQRLPQLSLFTALLSLLLFISNFSLGQSAGDYRSNAIIMNWDAAASWQKFDGSTWITATDYPGENSCTSCSVNIQNTHTVILNISPANHIGNIIVGEGASGTLTLGAFTLYDAGNLTVNTGAKLNLAAGTITIFGTTSIAGTITDASNAGVNTFTGLVTKTGGTWTSTAVTTPDNMVFAGGFSNNAGSFLAGAATVGDNQTLKGTTNMSFSNGLSVLGNGDITIDGTATAGVILGGSAVNYSVRNLYLTGLLTVSTTGNFTVTGTTIATGAGGFRDNNNAGVTSFSGLITHNSTGNWSSTSVTNPSNMIFESGFMNIAGKFNAGGATVGDNQTLTGIVNMYFSNGILIPGNADLNIAGTNNTGVTLGGISVNYTIRNLNITGALSVSTSGNFTVTGNANITGNGAFIDNNNAGVTSFGGMVTHNSTGIWKTTVVTTADNMIFNAGFTNDAGVFTAGGISLPGGQILNANATMTLYNPIAISGTGDVTITGTGGVRLSGAAINYLIPGNLTLTGSLLVNSTGNFTVNGSTSITGIGNFTDNNNTGTTTFNGLITHNSTGKWLSTAVTTADHMVFAEGFTNTAGIFSAGAATIGDDKTLTGISNMNFANGITVLGNADIHIAGTTTTGVILSGGSATHYSFRNIDLTGLLTISTTGNLTVNGTLIISGSGAFTDNNGTGITTFNGLVTVGATSTFTATAVATIGKLIFNGGIIQNNTAALAFIAGSIRTAAVQTWSGPGDIKCNGELNVNTGSLSNAVTGTLICAGTLTGNTLIQSTDAKLALGNATPLTITTLDATAAGNTVTYNGISVTIRSQTYHHLTIAGSGNKSISTTDITINGNLTISSGVLSNTTNNKNILLAGDWINNAGTSGFTPGAGTVFFKGTSLQNLGGTAVTTFSNVTVNNAAGVNQTINSLITGTLNLTAGIVSTGSTTIIINNSGTVNRTAGHINGNEQRNIPAGAGITRRFDVGDAVNYTPVSLTFANVSAAGNISIKTTGAEHPSLAAAYLDGALSINRYWTLNNSGTIFSTYNAVFNFVTSDKDGAANTASLIAGRYNGSWTYPIVGTKTANSTQVTGLTGFGDFALAQQLACSTPVVLITDPAAVCAPATANLTAPAVTAGSAAGLAYSYWRDAAATISLSSPSAAVAGTYYIKGTVALGGCSDTKPVLVSRRNPTGILSGSATICNGGSALLSITVTGNGPWNGILSDGTVFSGSSSPLTVTVAPISNTTYTITTLSDAGCTAQAIDKTGSAVITIAGAPTTAIGGSNQTICGGTVILAANTPVAGTGSWSVVSGTGGSFTDSSNPSSSFNGTSNTSYVVRWSITNGCTTSTDDVNIDFTSSWTGTYDSDWNNGANWCGNIVPSGIVNLVLTSGLPHYPVITGNIIINDLSVDAGAAININNNASVTIKGNYSNSGTLTNNGSIILNGSSQQNFPGSTATVIALKNLEIDNTSGVIINQSFSISGTLASTNGTLYLIDKTITLTSNAAGTARVSAVGGGFNYTGGGKFVVERYIPARRAWRLMTSPLTSSSSIYDGWQNAGVYEPGKGILVTDPSGSTGFDAASNASFKEYDIASQSLLAIGSTLGSVSQGNSGSADNTGYFVFVRGDRNPANLTPPHTNATTVSSAGRLQTGPQTFTAASFAGKVALIGNPYASPIDFNNVSRNNLLKRFYVWDASLNTVGGYVMLDDLDNDGVFSSSVSASTQTSELLSHQAFFVETAADGAASLTINETDKTDGSTYASSRPLSSTIQSLDVSLYLLNADNTTILADGVKAEFDNAYSDQVNNEDALKFGNVNETFALLRHSKALTLERRGTLQPTDSLFLKLTKTTQRNYQFVFNPGRLDSYSLTGVLKDNYLGTETIISLHDLTTVNFTVNAEPASAAANRFIVLFKSFEVLPVTFTNVKAYQLQQAIAIEWNIANTTGIVQYEVEKSTDGNTFNNTGHVAATENTFHYSWADESPATGNNFYRIKSIERSGKIQYSQTVKVLNGNKKAGISIYPNPLQNNTINLQFNNQPAGKYNVQLMNNNGQIVFTTIATVTGNNMAQAIAVPQLLAKGVYQIIINNMSETKLQQQVLVQ
jgi:hypothetical protein